MDEVKPAPGSRANPVEISSVDYWHLTKQFEAMEERYDLLPTEEERQEYRAQCRALIMSQYPWAYDNCHVVVKEKGVHSDWASMEAAHLLVSRHPLTKRDSPYRAVYQDV